MARDAELAALGAFLDAIDEGPAALLLEGEAGIGKTTLWTAGIRAACSRRIYNARCRRPESSATC